MPFTSHKNIQGSGRILLDFHNPCIGVRRNPDELALDSLGGLQRKPFCTLGLCIRGFSSKGQYVSTCSCTPVSTTWVNTYIHGDVATALGEALRLAPHEV